LRHGSRNFYHTADTWQTFLTDLEAAQNPIWLQRMRSNGQAFKPPSHEFPWVPGFLIDYLIASRPRYRSRNCQKRHDRKLLATVAQPSLKTIRANSCPFVVPLFLVRRHFGNGQKVDLQITRLRRGYSESFREQAGVAGADSRRFGEKLIVYSS
jgi:hypothetical protein